jgi:hypothetical protein
VSYVIDHSWCDDAAAAAAAIEIMRLTTAPPDEQERVLECAVAACDLISQYLDRCTPFDSTAIPAALANAHVQVTIELYRRKDAPFGTLNTWSPDDAPLTVPGDPLRAVMTQILPFKERWPVG